MFLSQPMYFTLTSKPIKGNQNVSAKTVSRRHIFFMGQFNNLVLCYGVMCILTKKKYQSAFCCFLYCPNRSKTLLKAGLRIVPIIEVGHSGYLGVTTNIAPYSRMSYSECRTPNNRISQPEFSTPRRSDQLCIQILFKVGHPGQNILLYGVGHSYIDTISSRAS